MPCSCGSFGDAVERQFNLKWQGKPFRTFVHPVERMEQLVARAGFELVNRRCTVAWCVDVFMKRPEDRLRSKTA
jgi:hypothetical protein